jgi:hypothetical protein
MGMGRRMPHHVRQLHLLVCVDGSAGRSAVFNLPCI